MKNYLASFLQLCIIILPQRRSILVKARLHRSAVHAQIVKAYNRYVQGQTRVVIEKCQQNAII